MLRHALFLTQRTGQIDSSDTGSAAAFEDRLTSHRGQLPLQADGSGAGRRMTAITYTTRCASSSIGRATDS